MIQEKGSLLLGMIFVIYDLCGVGN